MCSRRKDAQPGNYTSCQFVMHEHFGQTVADYLISGERTPKLNTTVRVLGRQFEHPPQNPQAFGDSCAVTPVMHASNSAARTFATGNNRSQSGRAPCWERGGPDREHPVVAISVKHK